MLPELRGSVDHLAINVELKLAPRVIANAHRRRIKIAAESAEFPFLWGQLPEDGV